MARRVLADFDDELLQRLANRTDITSTKRTFYLQDAYLKIANMFPHPELQGLTDEVLAASSGTVIPSVSNIWWPEFVKDVTNGREIDGRDRNVIERNRIVSGQPTEYYWWANVFRFNRMPTANTNISIWYKKTVVELTTNTSPVFQQLYDPLIPMLAAKLALEIVGNQQAAHIQDVEFRNYVSEFKFPTYEQTKDDRRQGLQVRYR